MLGKLGAEGVQLGPELVAFLTQVEPVGGLRLGLRLISVQERHAMLGVHQGRQLALEGVQLSRDLFQLIQIGSCLRRGGDQVFPQDVRDLGL